MPPSISSERTPHTDMSDRGPDSVKTKSQDTLDQFLSEDSSSNLRPADTNKLIVSDPGPWGREAVLACLVVRARPTRFEAVTFAVRAWLLPPPSLRKAVANISRSAK